MDDVLLWTASMALTDMRVAVLVPLIILIRCQMQPTANCAVADLRQLSRFARKNANCGEMCGKRSLNSLHSESFLMLSSQSGTYWDMLVLCKLKSLLFWFCWPRCLEEVSASWVHAQQRGTLHVTVRPMVWTLWDLGVRRKLKNRCSSRLLEQVARKWHQFTSVTLPTHEYTWDTHIHTHAVLLPPAECINHRLTGGCWMSTPQG